MNTIQTAYVNALLADAAYVDVSVGINSADMRTRLTPTQAAYLAANFTVKASVETPNTINPALGTGFDAVVWEGKADTPYAGQTYVSMRGTQGGTDIADDASLASKGLPYDQIRDMVNWWLKSTASTTDQNVVQIKVVDIPGAVIGKTFALDTPTTGTGFLSGLGPITAVNGHSLGGYLSTVFTHLFGAHVQAVNTFNSAGFSNVMSINTQGELLNIANMIGVSRGRGSLDAVSSIQTNFYADNGWEFTTNTWGEKGFLVPGFTQYGSRAALYQEDLVSVGGFGMDNHSMYKLTDQLALGNALAQLDGNLSTEQLNTLVKAGSEDMKASYEGLLDALRRLLLGPNATATPTSDSADSNERSTYHANLKDLTDSPTFKTLAASGKVTLSAVGTALASTAKTDFGSFLALQFLSPAVLSTNDPAALTALRSVHGQMAIDWQADRNARLYGDTAYAYSFSEQWYEDRAALLQAMSVRNQQDTTSGQVFDANARSGQVTFFDFVDSSTDQSTTLSTLTPGASGLPNQLMAFGGEGADTLTGSNVNRLGDRLYGGAGSDTLNGMGGNDYLEGGDGTDTYQFTGLWGKDLVADTDGSGSIQIDGQTLGTAKGAGQLNTWVAELGAGSGVYVGMSVYDDARSSTGKRLVIVKGSDTANTITITINNFNLTQAQSATGYLGIQLDPARKLVVKEAAGGINTWSDARFEASSLAGQSSSVIEGSAKTFTVYLNQAAQAGETLTLSLGALGNQFQALITPPGSTPSVVNAQGAVITLVAGQTQASFVLLQQGAVSANASAQLSVSYAPAQGNAVQSNAWTVNLQDGGAVGQTQRGDQRAKVIGTEIDLGTPPSNARYGTYKWEATSWGADGTLIGGVAAANFSDVLRGTAGNDTQWELRA